MISSANRFHGHGSLRFVYKNGTSIRSRWLTIKCISNPKRKKSRLGVIISKKVHKSAVGRNRIRRRVYEVMRQELPRFGSSYDIAVIIISGDFLGTTPAELTDHIKSLLAQSPVYSQKTVL